MTQKQQIIRHLKRHRRITKLTAVLDLGIGNLGARIGELRAAGMKIQTRMVTNRRTRKTHAVYSL